MWAAHPPPNKAASVGKSSAGAIRFVIVPSSSNQRGSARPPYTGAGAGRPCKSRSQGGSFFGWLARTAVNKAPALHRQRARTGKALASFESLVAPLREGAPAAEAERRLDQRRLRAAVEDALSQLSPRYRRAIEL